MLKEVYPNAVILVGEILPHRTDQQANGGISTINYLIEETHASLDGDISYVQHPICMSDNELYDSDGIHLNKRFGTPQILKDFYRVKQGRKPIFLQER